MSRQRTRGALMGLSLAGLVTAMLLVAAVIFASPIARSTGLRTAGVQPSTVPSSVFAPPAPTSAPPQQSGDGVVGSPAPVTPSATANPAALQRQLAALENKHGGRASLVILDHATGATLASSRANDLMIPASNMKTLVTMAALESLGAGHRFTTSVLAPSPGRIVLVGGGDPYLGRVANPHRPGAATTQQLAQATARALKAEGRTSVTLGYDATVFEGANWHPSWPEGYSDQVAKISALSVDAGRQLDAKGDRVPGSPLSQNPALDAATTFAAQLKAAGIQVTGKIEPQPRAGTAVAEVQSMALIDVATEVMVHSDNFGAEVLFRQLALAAGRPGSFAEGEKALQAALANDGIWRQGAVTTDGSGLSRSNRVSAAMLAASWQRISQNPGLQGLLVSTPVAGVSGTLADRFRPDSGGAAGRGWVHAKTGTLTGVSTLSGWTVSTDGQPLVLAILVNDSKNDWFARVWIDQVASTATGCGCR